MVQYLYIMSEATAQKKKMADINFDSIKKTIKISSNLQFIVQKNAKTQADLLSVLQQIKKNDLLYLIENFELICKLLRPLLVTWSRRPADCPLKQAIKQILKQMGQNIFAFQEYISVMLPQYNIFCEFAKRKIGHDYSTCTIVKVKEEFESHKYLSKFINFLEKKSDTAPSNSEFCNERVLSQIETKLKEHIFGKQKQHKQKRAQKVNPAMPQSVINNYVLQLTCGGLEIDRRCLNCAKFFYENSYFCFERSLSFFEVDFLELGEANKLTEIESQVRSSVCSFFNTQQGGLILIGCKNVGMGMQIIGIELTQKEKEAFQQRIQNYMSSISPLIKRNRQIFIDFIPIFTNPGESGTQEHIQGMFVARIRVFPLEMHKLYYHRLKSSDSVHSQIRNFAGKSQQLKAENWYQLILDKYNAYSHNRIRKDARIGGKRCDKIIYCHYNIECQKPERGKQFTDDDRQQKCKKIKQELQIKYKEKVQDNDKIIEHQGDNASEKEKVELKESNLKYITILIATKQIVDEVEKLCNADEKIKGVIIKKVEYKEKYPDSKKAYMIYHQCKFQKIKSIIDTNKLKSHLIQALKYLEVQYKKNSNMGNYLDANSLHFLDQVWAIFLGHLENEVPGGTMVKRVQNKEIKDRYVQILEFETLEAAIFAYFYAKTIDLVQKTKFRRRATVVNSKDDKFKNKNVPKTEMPAEISPASSIDYNYSDYNTQKQYNSYYQQQQNFYQPQYQSHYQYGYDQNGNLFYFDPVTQQYFYPQNQQNQGYYGY